MQHSEGQVLKLPLDTLDSQSVSQRSVDVESFLGLSGRRLRAHKPPGPRVVQTIGELNQENSDVLGHRNNHLANGFGLRVVSVLDLVELGDTIDEHGDLFAKVFAKLI